MVSLLASPMPSGFYYSFAEMSSAKRVSFTRRCVELISLTKLLA
jgi:hypothetical protein